MVTDKKGRSLLYANVIGWKLKKLGQLILHRYLPGANPIIVSYNARVTYKYLQHYEYPSAFRKQFISSNKKKTL
jgi:hypothetical protein